MNIILKGKSKMEIEIRAVYYENDVHVQSFSDKELPVGVELFKRSPDAFGIYIRENGLLRWIEDFENKEQAELATLKPRIYLQAQER